MVLAVRGDWGDGCETSLNLTSAARFKWPLTGPVLSEAPWSANDRDRCAWLPCTAITSIARSDVPAGDATGRHVGHSAFSGAGTFGRAESRQNESPFLHLPSPCRCLTFNPHALQKGGHLDYDVVVGVGDGCPRVQGARGSRLPSPLARKGWDSKVPAFTAPTAVAPTPTPSSATPTAAPTAAAAANRKR